MEYYINSCLQDNNFMCDIANDYAQMERESDEEGIVSMEEYARSVAMFQFNRQQHNASVIDEWLDI